MKPSFPQSLNPFNALPAMASSKPYGPINLAGRSSPNNPRRGFSLLELLVVLAILGIVMAIGVPGINRARDDAETEGMRAKAVALQNAKQAYLTAVSRDSANAFWSTNYPTDETRYYNLLRPYLPDTYPSKTDGTNLAALGFSGSYSIDLGSDNGGVAGIDQPVTLKKNNVSLSLMKY